MAFLSASLGNSRFSLALFEGDRLRKKGAWPLSDPFAARLDEFLRGERAEDLGLCSVNPPRERELEEGLRKATGRPVRKVGRDLSPGIPNRTLEPERVGADRLLVARAGWERVRGKLLVLDFGTAVTLNAVNEKGEFLGGAIAPGFRLAARALRDGTAQLRGHDAQEGDTMPHRVPLLRIVSPRTEEAIAAGIHFGLLGMAEKWIETARGELGGAARVLATGGDLERFRAARGIDEFLPDLLHEGIRLACSPR